MWKQIGCGILAVARAHVHLLPRAGANRNFVPDWTFQGSSLGSARTLGSAQWRAENGEIIGTPKTAEGGWLILDKPLQDVQFASNFRSHHDDLGRARRLRAAHRRVDLLGVELAALLVHRRAAAESAAA